MKFGLIFAKIPRVDIFGLIKFRSFSFVKCPSFVVIRLISSFKDSVSKTPGGIVIGLKSA